MNNLTKLKINKPAHEVFEAFVDPAKIGNFWFSSSSERWEAGKTITLRYDEYNAEGTVKITGLETNKKIVMDDWEGHTTTITLKKEDPSTTIIEVNEEGFDENDVDRLLDNKEGWVYTLTCLKAYVEFGISTLRASLVK
ncbi:SRPBCC domain-containing protein [Niallia oryzisoli]|uniref:SRPBCC domain-containing protein n=1 Tax=Niallia oryzisoli TaxID=1737571 RepID=A0ABZ2CQR4_9BACI